MRSIEEMRRAGAALTLLAVALAGPAAAQEVVAAAGGYTLTAADLRDLIVIDELVVAAPLTAADQMELRAIATDEFRAAPDLIGKALPAIHQAAESFRRSGPYDRAVTRETIWESTVKTANEDPVMGPFAKRALAVLERYVPVIAAGNGLVVTERGLEAMLQANDHVAAIAGQPKATAAQRQAYAAALRERFPSLTLDQQERLGHAERRWIACQDIIYGYSDHRAKAEGLIRANVHSPEEVATEARVLEDEAMKFYAAINSFGRGSAAIAGKAIESAIVPPAISRAAPSFSRH